MKNDKPTLILLPGMLCNETLWEHQTAHLADMADIRITDLTRADSVREMALATLAESPQHFALAGFSLGGIVAFEIMRLAPERVTHLALLDTTPRLIRPETADLWRPIADTNDPETFVSLAVNQLSLMMNPQHRETPALFHRLQNMVSNVGVQGLRNQLHAQIHRPDSRAALPQINVPTLILAGRDDSSCPLEVQLEMADSIPNSMLALIPRCGHFSCIEQPEKTTSMLRWWLTDFDDGMVNGDW